MPQQGTHSDADLLQPTQSSGGGGRAGAFTDADLQDAQATAVASMRPPPTQPKSWRETAEDWAAPVLGGVGAIVGGGIPGAAAGAAYGTLLSQKSRQFRTAGQPAPPPGPPPSHGYLSAAPATTPPPPAAPSGLDNLSEIATGAITSGVLPELGGRAISGTLRGPMRPAAGSTDAALGAANKEMGLRLGAQDIVPTSKLGTIGHAVSHSAEATMAGATIANLAHNEMRRAALKGAASGEQALQRVGSTLNAIVKRGPEYNMQPHKIDATRIFGEEVAPALLQVKGQALPQTTKDLLTKAASGDLSPAIALKAIQSAKRALQRGNPEAVPMGTLDTLEKILSTTDTLRFDNATKLRTGLAEIGRKGDSVLPDRGIALNKKFTGDLTTGMDTAYPEWTPARQLYAKGAQGLADTPAGKLLEPPPGTTASADITAARTEAQSLKAGDEAKAIGNLHQINEALQRGGGKPGVGWVRWAELGAPAAAFIHGGVGEAAGTAMGVEALSSLITWASHSPTMTKLLTEGITSRDTSVISANLLRLAQAYAASQGPSSGPPPASPRAQSVGPNTGPGGGALGRGGAMGPPPGR